LEEKEVKKTSRIGDAGGEGKTLGITKKHWKCDSSLVKRGETVEKKKKGGDNGIEIGMEMYIEPTTSYGKRGYGGSKKGSSRT